MAPEIVHPVAEADADAFLRTTSTALMFGFTPDVHARFVDSTRRDWTQYRLWGARDDGRWVGTLGTMERRLTVPGAGAATNDIAVDALTLVSVAGTHRRRGLMRSVLTRSLDDARDRGLPVSILIAAEWPIYGRFGYAPATTSAKYVLHPRHPGASVAGYDQGSIRQVERADLAPLAESVFEAARRTRPGQIDRLGTWWNRRLGQDGYGTPSDPDRTWVVHEGRDGPDGLLGWQPTRPFGLTELPHVEVIDLAAATDDAYRDLWGYVATLDLAEQVSLASRPVDEPVRWLLGDGRALAQTDTHDMLWLNVLDVPAALSARGYALEGDIVLDVDGERFRLRAAAQDATCVATSDTADLRLTRQALGAVYLGGHRLRQRAIAGDVVELTPGALDRADVMFSAPLPAWCQTGF